MGFHGDFRGFHMGYLSSVADFMGFSGGFVSNGGLVGFSGDFVGFSVSLIWDTVSPM